MTTTTAMLAFAVAAGLATMTPGLDTALPRKSFNEAAEAAREGRTIYNNWFLRGMLTNLLNPKVGVFYVTLLPQFVPARIAEPGALMVAFATIHAVEGIVWFSLLIAATGFLAPWLRRSRVVETIDRDTGAVLMAFGVRLALAKL